MKKELVVIASIILAFYRCEAAGGCGNNWVKFSSENACVLDVKELKSWEDARKNCQTQYKADLVQILDKKKADFLNTRVISYSSRWIGLLDKDGDGLYEWLNGSKLNMDEDYGAPTVLDKIRDRKRTSGEKMIVLQEYSPRYWAPQDFAQRQLVWSMCEKYLDDTKDDDDDSCASLECKCDKKTWTYFEKGKKYIMVSSIDTNFADAQAICEHNGGQLLKVTDGDTKAFIKGVSKGWKKWGSLYWMGLNRESKAQKWKWQDTSSPPVKDLDWATNPYDDLHCVGVIWHQSTQWRATFCSSTNPFICESRDPCNTRVFFAMDGIRRVAPDHSPMVVTNHKETTFDCSGKGYLPITEAIFNCTDVAGFNKTGPPGKVTGKVTIDLTFYQAVCTCTLKLQGGTQVQDSMEIDYRTRTLLVRETETLPTYYAFSGDTLTFSEEVYANPQPRYWNLSKDGLSETTPPCNVTFEYTNKSVIHKVTFSMPGFKQTMTGLYNLTVGNGIGDQAALDFRLALKTKPSSFSSSSWIIIGLLVIAGLLALLGLILMKRAKRATDEDHEPEVVPEDPNDAAAEEHKDATDEDIAEHVSEANDKNSEGNADDTAPKSDEV